MVTFATPFTVESPTARSSSMVCATGATVVSVQLTSDEIPHVLHERQIRWKCRQGRHVDFIQAVEGSSCDVWHAIFLIEQSVKDSLHELPNYIHNNLFDIPLHSQIKGSVHKHCELSE